MIKHSRKVTKSPFKILFFLILLPYLAYGALLFEFQNSMIFHPKKFLEGDAPINWTRISYKTSAGEQNAYLAIGGKLNANSSENIAQLTKLWIVFSGNASVSLNWLDFISSIKEADVGFLLIDYPGYGLNQGQPSQETIKESYRNALSNAIGKFNLEKKKFNFIGYSLGCAMALESAVEFSNTRTIDKIILLAPFTSTRDMADIVVGWPLRDIYPLSLMLKTNYDNLVAIDNLKDKAKIIIFHGIDDEKIPFHMGEKLSKSSDKIVFNRLTTATHGNILTEARDALHSEMRQE